MNNTTFEETVIDTTQPAYSKDEFIILLKKALHDYNMIDIYMKEMLISKDINKENMEDFVKKFNEANIILNEYSVIRNNKIEEILKSLKN
jgi:patatin-like phospholipase/acyl hydrolase